MTQDYWAAMPVEKLVTGYLLPHAMQAELEGQHVKALALREAARRLSGDSERVGR